MGKNKHLQKQQSGSKTTTVKDPEELKKVLAEKEAKEAADKTATDKKPEDKKPETKPAEKPAEKKEEKPADKKEEKPADKKPASDKPADKKEDKPADKKPADKPVDKKEDKHPPKKEDKPADKQPASPAKQESNVTTWKPLPSAKIEQFMVGVASALTGGNGISHDVMSRSAQTWADIVKLNPNSPLMKIQDSVEAIVAMFVMLGNLQLFGNVRHFGIGIKSETSAKRMVEALIILGADVKLSENGTEILANVSDEVYKAIQSDQAAKNQLALNFKESGEEATIEEGYEIPDASIERTEDEKKGILRIILSKDRGANITLSKNLKDAVDWYKIAYKFEGTFAQTVARIMLRFNDKKEAGTMLFETITKSVGNALFGSRNPFDAFGVITRSFKDSLLSKTELFELFQLYVAKYIGRSSDGPDQTKAFMLNDKPYKQVMRAYNLETIEKIVKGENLTYTEEDLKALGLAAEDVKFESKRLFDDWCKNTGSRTGEGQGDHLKLAKELMIEFADYLVNNPQKTLYDYAEEKPATTTA
jgi:hypothetical protein